MKTRKTGFTLIELLVVVAIIAVLIAILLPSLGKARDQAKTVKCAANYHSVYQGLTTYSAEFDNWGMPCKINSPGGGAANSYWFGPQLLGSAWGKNAALAVSDSGYAGNVTNKNVGSTGMSMAQMLYCPAIDKPTKTSADQDQNSYTYTRIYGDSANSAAFPGMKLTALTGYKIHETLIFTEVHGGAEKGTDDWYFGPKVGGASPNFTYSNGVDSLTLFPNPLSKHGTTILAVTPHNGGKKGNMMFADGAVITDNIFKIATPNKLESIVDPVHNERSNPFPF